MEGFVVDGFQRSLIFYFGCGARFLGSMRRFLIGGLPVRCVLFEIESEKIWEGGKDSGENGDRHGNSLMIKMLTNLFTFS